jgi:hypothetical protein
MFVCYKMRPAGSFLLKRGTGRRGKILETTYFRSKSNWCITWIWGSVMVDSRMKR